MSTAIASMAGGTHGRHVREYDSGRRPRGSRTIRDRSGLSGGGSGACRRSRASRGRVLDGDVRAHPGGLRGDDVGRAGSLRELDRDARVRRRRPKLARKGGGELLVESGREHAASWFVSRAGTESSWGARELARGRRELRGERKGRAEHRGPGSCHEQGGSFVNPSRAPEARRRGPRDRTFATHRRTGDSDRPMSQAK